MRRAMITGVLLSLILLAGCTGTAPTQDQLDRGTQEDGEEPRNITWETATFAGGCFWCTEAIYEGVDGVGPVVSGFAGGDASTATYDQVLTGSTDHREAVQLRFDPEQVSYRELLDIYWRNIDPTDAGGQFVDRGLQYTTAIYAHDQDQYREAIASKQELAASDRFDEPIVTEVLNYTTFFRAADEHQNFSTRRTFRYETYKAGSGRNEFFQEVWSPQSDYQDEIANLSSMERYVTQNNGTEPPYANKYYDHKEAGIYVDVVSGQPLFSSTHKYESGTGWPSFWRPISKDLIVTRKDPGVLGERVEVASAEARSHLGHVFNDGPEPTGLRYCLNSAALEFVPKEEMAEKGYGDYLYLFNESG